MTSWLLPSMAPVVPNSANKNANKCLGCRWSIFCDFCKIDECGLFGANFDYLRRSHHKFLFLAHDRVWIFILDDTIYSLQELIISVVTVLVGPCSGFIFTLIFFIFIVDVVYLSPLFLLLFCSKRFKINIIIIL